MKEDSKIPPTRGSEEDKPLILFSKFNYNSMPSPLTTLLTRLCSVGTTVFVSIIIMWCIMGEKGALIPIAVSNFH